MEIEYYDDLDDFDGEPQFANEDIISIVCFPIVNSKEVKNIGTGFLINKDGYFISVAHNFKDPVENLKVYTNDDWYDIELICKEYDKEIYSDLVIGRIVNLPNSYTYELNLPYLYTTQGNIDIGSEIKLLGFKSTSLIEADKLKEIYFGNGRSSHKLRITRNIIDPKDDTVFTNIPSLICNEKILFFEKHSEDNKLGGFSGGPVYRNEGIFGLIISHYFLKMEYIIPILNNLKIDYKSIEK